MELLAFFEWWDASILAEVAKSSGGVFAAVQTVHLVSLALLGGMIIASDLRLLNLILVDVPVTEVIENTQKWINRALVALALSGIYQASAVTIKLYYNSFFWSKMAGLVIGLTLLYMIKLPLLRGNDIGELNPWTVRLVAIASLMTWLASLRRVAGLDFRR